MALVLKDRVKEQTTTTGTGTITLGGTVSGFESFASVGDGNTTYYAIVNPSADEWEVGLGTYTAAGTLLSRDTILESSNSDAAVNFSAGTKDVFVTYPSDKAVYADAAGEVSVTRATSATFATSATEAATALFATSATNATTAVSATNATSATFATSATRATSATFATSATEAATAIFATSATNATTAVSATNATSATFATSATNATTAINVNGGTVSATTGTFTGTLQSSTHTVGTNSTGNSATLQSATGFQFKLNGDTASQLGVLSWNNNSGTQTGNMWGTGDDSASTVLRVKSLGSVDIVPGGVGIDGTAGWNHSTSSLTAPDAAGPALLNESASSTNPTIIPNKTDTDTGVGWASADTLTAVTGGSERMRIDSSGNVGIGTTSPDKQFEITQSSRATITTLTDAASISVDFDTAQNFSVTLAGNRTLENPSNIDPGQTGSIFVIQDTTGGRTVSFGSVWKFAGGTAPTLSTGTSATDRIDYVVQTSVAIHAVASLNVT